MTRIWKFTLEPGVTEIRGVVRVLGVGWQLVDDGRGRGYECRLWAEVDPADQTPAGFAAVLTGEEPPPPDVAEFIGTAVGPIYVAHIYRLGVA